MRILLARANPRKDGHTQHVTDLLRRGAAEAGAQIDEVDLTKAKIAHCVGCFRCWTATPGRCAVHDDDMDELTERLLAADVLMCSTPLYHYSATCSLLAFLERSLPLTQYGFEVNPLGLMRNKTRYPERWKGKRLGFIACGAFRSPRNFEGMQKTFELTAGGMNMELCARLIRPESFLLPFHLARPKRIKTVETALVQAGREIVVEGAVSEETTRRVATPLSDSLEDFMKYSHIYWENAVTLGPDATDMPKVQRSVLTDVRILIYEMARSIDPAATARVRAVMQFDFPDCDKHFRVAIDRGACRVTETASDECDLRVTVDSGVWAAVFMREKDARRALLDKEIRLEGEKMLFTRLDRFFPPPAV